MLEVMTVSRYIVQPLLGSRGIPYYVVIDTASDKGIEGYGCETWARHRADELNRTAKWVEILGSRNELHTIK